MKKTYKAIAMIRATPEGYSIWIPKEALTCADAMPVDDYTATLQKENKPA
jgi:hypothetical protein